MQTKRPAAKIIYTAPPEKLPPSALWGVAIMVGLLILIFGGAYGGLWIWDITGPRPVMVPNLIGVEERAALEILARQGLKGEVVARQHHERLAAGRVMRTFPGPNAGIKQGRTIEMVVSAGSGWVNVPEVTEMSLARAREKIEQAGLRIGWQRRRASEEVPEGYVVAQEPVAGSRLRRGVSVNLVISSGSERSGAISREGRLKYARVQVSLPAGEGTRRVRIEVQDDEGERVAYEGEHAAASNLARTVVGTGNMTVKVYADDELIQEKTF